MLFIQIFLIIVIVAGIIYLLFLRKRNKFNPSQSQRDPFEVILEATEMIEDNKNNASPLKYLRIMKYVRQETGMGFFELKRYVNNSASPYLKLEDPEVVSHLKDMLENHEDENQAVKYVQDCSGLNFEKAKDYVDKFKKADI
ncbi:hypothetical protein [Oceanobacillus oncorhynchi]|uniref:hypothetical protein n=1 Tax=Oceanobacillus oncorhynchi TaxID=545501 RepID=UPI001865DB9A|nr:hypothetical protein [Oceanobacillus oncorhynchi]MDM8100750.1 hypothetical protein [Oceanobacillus oncorhynchi]UUI41392.1 hypothetical protein NP440_07575 [Oceanobacillus oncorhynchi]